MISTLLKKPKLRINNAILFLCDIQEKFRQNIIHFPDIVENSNKILSAAKLLNIPIVVTEQYPKGLGKTVSELDLKGTKVFDKTQFSMCIDPVMTYMDTNVAIKNIILCGIETHACIQQTALDLSDKYNIYVISDATSSRSLLDRNIALKMMERSGITITTGESLLLSLMRDASHPKFKLIQKIITKSSQNNDLLY